MLSLKCFLVSFDGPVSSTVSLCSTQLATVCPESSIIVLLRSKKMHENKVVSSILGFWKMYTALRLLLRAKD